jgi:hypothetical protein
MNLWVADHGVGVIPAKAEIINAVIPAKAGIQGLNGSRVLCAKPEPVLCRLRRRILVGG